MYRYLVYIKEEHVFIKKNLILWSGLYVNVHILKKNPGRVNLKQCTVL